MKIALLIKLPFLRTFTVIWTLDWVDDEDELIVALAPVGQFGFVVPDIEEDEEYERATGPTCTN